MQIGTLESGSVAAEISTVHSRDMTALGGGPPAAVDVDATDANSASVCRTLDEGHAARAHVQ